MYTLNTAQSVLENWSEYLDSKVISGQPGLLSQRSVEQFSVVLTRVLKQTGNAVLLQGDLNSNDEKNRAAGRDYSH